MPEAITLITRMPTKDKERPTTFGVLTVLIIMIIYDLTPRTD